MCNNFLNTNKNNFKSNASLKNLKNFVWFTRGDVLSIRYRLNGFGFLFTGLCLGVKKKNLLNIATAFLLRNIIAKVSVEVSLSLHSLLRFSFTILEYTRKKLVYRSSKLYYLSDSVNLETIIRVRQ